MACYGVVLHLILLNGCFGAGTLTAPVQPQARTSAPTVRSVVEVLSLVFLRRLISRPGTVIDFVER
jgi:hypothetical protein